MKREPAPPDTDLALVERTLAGDQRAFGLLVMKYQRRVQRLVGRMVRDAAMAEDIAQESFVRAYRALHTFRGDAQFYTWLYRIAVNTARKFLQQRRTDPTYGELSVDVSQDEEPFCPRSEPSTHETPETVLAARELAAAVDVALEALHADLRQAVVLREIEGLSYEEIALAMNCPVGTVRSRIFRAREAISEHVRPLLDRQGGKRW